MPPLLHLSADVRAQLNPTDLDRIRHLRYTVFTCVVCGTESTLHPDEPANVVLIATTRHRVCSFAHQHCSPSKVITVPDYDLPERTSHGLDVATSVWIRPFDCQPHTVLLCRPAVTSWTSAHTAEQASDPLLTALVHQGFAPLTGLDDPFPALETLDATITADQLTITGPDADATTLLTCALLPPDPYTGPPWYRPTVAEGRLGVVILSGANPNIAPGPELEAAIHDGRAVAATARLAAETALSNPHNALTHPRRTPRTRHQGNLYLLNQPTSDHTIHPGQAA